MAYAGTWDRVFPSGAWRVWDDRLYWAGTMHVRQYYGYAKREAQQAHAQHIRELRKRGSSWRRCNT